MLFDVLPGVLASKDGNPKTSAKPPAHPDPRSDVCVSHTWFLGVGVLLGTRRRNRRVAKLGGGKGQKAMSQC